MNLVIGIFKKIGDFLRKTITKAVSGVVNWVKGKFGNLFGKAKDGEVVEEENPGSDVTSLSAADHKRHQVFVSEMADELKKPAQKKPSTFEEFYKEKQKLAKDLEKKYNKKLTKKVNGKPIKTTITMGSLAAEEKDGDLDLKIRISPNDASGEVELKMPNIGDERLLLMNSATPIDSRQKILDSFEKTIKDRAVINRVFELTKLSKLNGAKLEGRMKKAISDKAEGGFILQKKRTELHPHWHYVGFAQLDNVPVYRGIQRGIDIDGELGDAFVDSAQSLQIDILINKAIPKMNIRGVGTEIVKKAKSHFSGQFDSIGARWMRANWYKRGATGNYMSDNLATFIAGLSKNLSYEEAAKMTWSYRRAKEDGYSEVGEVNISPKDYENPNEILEVKTEFRKPIRS